MSNGALYVDSDARYQTVQPCSLPVLSSPIPGVATQYMLKQDFIQYEAYFSPAPMSTPYPKDDGSGGVSGETWSGNPGSGATANEYNSAGFILVAEGPQRDLGNGVVQWTRTYARVPVTHSQTGNISYNFIGFADTFLTYVIYRQRFTKTVPATVVYTYGTVTDMSQASITAYETANYVQEQLYLWPRYTAFPLPNVAQQTDYITNTSLPATIPTLAQYGTWVSTGSQIVAQPSMFEQWMGCIIRREVVYIVPQ